MAFTKACHLSGISMIFFMGNFQQDSLLLLSLNVHPKLQQMNPPLKISPPFFFPPRELNLWHVIILSSK